MPRQIDAFQNDEIEHYQDSNNLNPDKTFLELLFKTKTVNKLSFKSAEELYGSKKKGFQCPKCKSDNAAVQLRQKRCSDEPSTYDFQCRSLICKFTWSSN